MKGATLKATLERLGILASYSRPGVSDDNPYIESLFGTMTSRVGCPKKPFATLDDAQAWVNRFVVWYNEEHRHSALNWVTPMARTPARSTSCCVVAKRPIAKPRSATPNDGRETSETARQRPP